MEKLLHLSLLGACNQRCVFCAKSGYPQREIPLRECVGTLLRKRKEGFGRLYLDGGEPGLLKGLPTVCAAALKLGYRQIVISTNATAFGDGKIISELAILPAARKRISFSVSMHSREPAVSDRLTGLKGGLEKTLAGLARKR